MREILHLTEQEIKSIFSSNHAKVLVYGKILRDYELDALQNFESCFRRNRLEERDDKFVSEKFNSIFVTYEIQPGFYEVADNNNSLENLVKVDVSIVRTYTTLKL